MQVAATLTPSTAEYVAGAIVAAYRDLRGRDPPAKSSWLWPLALSANETARWQQMWNWNVGNVTTTGDAALWYTNPNVTTPLRFRAYADARSAALSMLKVLDRFGGVDAADRGDASGWQSAINAYLGGQYPPPWAIVASLDSIQPAGGFEVVTPPAPIQPFGGGSILLAATAAVAMAAAAGVAAAIGRSRPDEEEVVPP